MGLLGLLVYLSAFVAAAFLGYQGNFNPGMLGVIAFCVLIGQIVRRSGRSGRIFKANGFGILVEVVVMFAVGAIVVAIGYGLGYALLEMPAHRVSGKM